VIDVPAPRSDEEVAFLPLAHLSKLVEARKIAPTDLTKLYLARLKKYDPQLHCVVTLTEELAMRQALEADREIAAGRYRGPLHGIPYGLKDLFAVRGVKTTWGMTPFKDRVIDEDATVYERLTRAGAILVAKLSTGAIAVTAQWFGGLTRNPWNTGQDASGSSAGPGAATAAGLVGFSIGSDTGGSIIQPASRNGCSGIRPTFGRVSRYGGMTLAWTQDTVGPICRSAEDCALVLDVIHGPDGRDNTVLDVPFNWDATADVSRLRVGVMRAAGGGAADEETRRSDENALRVIRSLGVTIVPFSLPDVPIEAIDFIRYAETSAAFDEVTRAGLLTRAEEGPEQSRRPDEIRAGYFIPAVDFHPGEPLPHACDGTGRFRARRSRSLRWQQPTDHEPHGSPGNEHPERVLERIADRPAPHGKALRRAGDAPARARVSGEHGFSRAAPEAVDGGRRLQLENALHLQPRFAVGIGHHAALVVEEHRLAS
jgi:Asp-tRNA(Asn)/Glu-tRNA(Gln) amidotransferase A subunit family amidase